METTKFRRRAIASCLGLLFGLGMMPFSQAETTCVRDAWTEVPGAGITNGSGPTAVVMGSDLHLFVTGGGDAIYNNIYRSASGSWTGWGEVPGAGKTDGSGPAAAVFRGNLYLFVLGATGHIFVNTLAPAGWSGWIEVPGNGVGTAGLGAASFQRLGQRDELDVFLRGTDGAVYINRLTGTNTTSWSGWSEVPGGGLITYNPAATTFGDQYLYVRGIGGGIFENSRSLTTGEWRGWNEVPGNGFATAAPAAAPAHTTGIVLAIRGLGSSIYQNLLGTGGNQWTEVPGNGRATATAGPAMVVYQNAFQLFATGPGDRVLCTVPR
ncbi:MAG: hypothetical protein ACJ8LG_08465 [Massilia sp.]